MGVSLTLIVLFLCGFSYAISGETSKQFNTDTKRDGPDDSDSVLQNKRIQLLENENNAMKTGLKILQQKIDQIEASSNNKILTLKKELAKVNNFVSAQRQPLHSNETNQHIGKRMLLPDCHCSGGVAFSASMGQHQENLGIHQTVMFDHVITNVGNGFDPVTGIFKAPVSGTYFFTMVIMSHSGEDIETEMLKNNMLLVRAYSGDSTTWNEGTQSTVVTLNTGDDVFVRIVNNKVVNNGNVRIYGHSWSSFSGFLISK